MSASKRQAIPVAKKVEIIQYYAEHPSAKKSEIATHFGIKKQTLHNILQARNKVEDEVKKRSASQSESIKRLRSTNYDDVDAALILWFRQNYARPDIRIDGEMLLGKAGYFSSEFGHDTAPSDSWIDRWKKRWNIGKISKSGEAGSVDLGVVNEWRENEMKDILRKYKPCDIYNCDETGLFWQMLPEKSLGFTGESQSGCKQSKVRITLLVGTNMDGSDKIPILAIGKSANPRAFKNVKTLPVRYIANKKAWMRSDIFESEMRRFDRRMQLEGRKVCMIVDNCPAHPQLELNNVELVFLPPNTTSHTQPMDSGVIKNLKFYYRRKMAYHRLQAAETKSEFKWDILDCLLAVKSAWKQVKPETVVNCWRKAGFAELTGESDIVGMDAESESEARNIWDKLSELLGSELPNFDDYVALDDDVAQCTEELTEEEIVKQVRDDRDCVDDSVNSSEATEGNDPDRIQVTVQQASAALTTVRDYLLICDTSEDNRNEAILSTDKLEAFLVQQRASMLTQKKISDFFGNK